MPNEVEIKFRLHDVPALEQKLRDAGFHVLTSRTHELNMLYDFANGRLRKAGQLLRLREYGSKWTLTHKAPGGIGIHKTRVETQTQVADGEQMHEILLAVGLVPQFFYEKFRAEWTDGRGHVVIDETPIGNLAEIEGHPEWIDKIAATLGVERNQYITQNYAQLFQDWKKRTRSRAKNMTFKAVGSG